MPNLRRLITALWPIDFQSSGKISSALKQHICAVLLVPFLVMSAFSAGTMPVVSDNGTLRIVICTGSGPLEMLVGPDGGFTPADQSDHTPEKDVSCAWAMQAHQAVVIGVAVVLPQPVSLSVEPFSPPVPKAARTRYFPVPFARGPPLSV